MSCIDMWGFWDCFGNMVMFLVFVITALFWPWIFK